MIKNFFILFTIFNFTLGFGQKAYQDESEFIPTVCSTFVEPNKKLCGAGVTSTSMIHSKEKCQNGECTYLIYTSAHQVSGSNIEVKIGGESYSVKEDNYLIDGKSDLAILEIKIPEKKEISPYFSSIRDPNGDYIIPPMGAPAAGAISRFSKNQGQHTFGLPSSDQYFFSRVTITGNSSDSEISMTDKSPYFLAPFIPIRPGHNVQNLDSPNLGDNPNDLRSKIPLKKLRFSNRIVSAAHLDPGNSGAPLINYKLTETLYDGLDGIYSGFNYRMQQSLIASSDDLKKLIAEYEKGERGNLANYQGKPVIYKYDPITGSTYRTFLGGKIRENSHFTIEEYKSAGGGDAGDGSEDIGPSGGGDAGDGSDEFFPSGGGDAGDGSEELYPSGGGDAGDGSIHCNHYKNKESRTFEKIINYNSIKPGMIYDDKHVIGFKVKRGNKEYNLYSNTEALFALEELETDPKVTIEPILFNDKLNFFDLFQKKFTNGKKKSVNKKQCHEKYCFNIKFEKPFAKIEIDLEIDGKKLGKLEIDQNGAMKGIQEKVVHNSYFFTPWVNFKTGDGIVQADMRNLFFTDVMNSYQEEGKNTSALEAIKAINDPQIIISPKKKGAKVGSFPCYVIY